MKNYDDICTLLNNNNIQYEEYKHDSILTYGEGIKRTEFNPEKIVKTLAYKIDEQKILIALLGKDRLDYKKITDILSIKRNQLKMLSQNEITELGFEIGGVSPIISPKKAKVFLDSKIQNMDYIYCGMGSKDRTLKIIPEDLKKVSDAIYVELSKELEIEEE